MGRGNWFPGSNLEDCRVAYIDYSNADIEHDDVEAWQWQWQWVKEEIGRCLPKSFTMVDQYGDLPYHLQQPNWRDCSPLAYNGLYTLWCDAQGDNYHLGIGFTVNEDAPAFAKAKLDEVADRFFDAMSDAFETRVRTSAWTSAPYQRKSPQHA